MRLVASAALPAGPGPARRAGHRLGGRGQPRPGPAAALRRRPLAVRHHGRAVRRRGAVGPAARRGPDAARRWRWCSTGCRQTRSRRSGPTWPTCCGATTSATRRCSSSPRSALEDDRLPDWVIERLRSWLTALARDAKARSMVVRRTLLGTLRALDGRVTTLVSAAQAQRDGVHALRAEVAAAYDAATRAVNAGLTDGTLLRGEVLARWQEFVGTGELLRNLEAGVGRIRDRIVSAVRGRPAPSAELGEALQTGVAALVTAQAREAAADAARRWRGSPAGVGAAGGQPRAGAAGRGPDRPGQPDGPRLAGVHARARARGGQPAPLGRARAVVRRQRAGRRADARGVQPDRRSRPGPRSGSQVAQRLWRNGCWRRCSATRPCGCWPPRPDQELQDRVDALLESDRKRLEDMLDALELDSRPTSLDQAQTARRRRARRSAAYR